MSWFDRLRQGLGKTRDLLTQDASRNWEMDWEDLEFALIGADVDAKISAEVVEAAKAERERGMSFRDALEKALLDQLEPNRMRQKLRRVGFQLDVTKHEIEPAGNVIMVVGVNGVGKTTTIAKLGSYYRSPGRSVMFAAGQPDDNRARRDRPGCRRLRRGAAACSPRHRPPHRRHRRPPAYAAQPDGGAQEGEARHRQGRPG